jgi:O-antigen/teichoic acid export membrane protein
LSSASLPKLAGASADQERALLTLGLRMLLAVLMPICAAANMLMAPFLHYWVGDLVAGKGAPVGCILIFGFWMHGIGHIPSTVLQGRGRPDIVAKLLLAYLVPYFAALFAMLHFFGIVGAAIVWSLRASMDLWLFRWARTPRREAVDVGLCSTLVLASSVLALLLDWRGVTFWIVLGSALLVSGALAIWVAPPVLRDWLGKAVRLTPAVEH